MVKILISDLLLADRTSVCVCEIHRLKMMIQGNESTTKKTLVKIYFWI